MLLSCEFAAPTSQGSGFQVKVPFSSSFFDYVVVELLSRARLFCDPMDCSPPGSSVHGKNLEWVAISSFRGAS